MHVVVEQTSKLSVENRRGTFTNYLPEVGMVKPPCAEN